MDLGRRQGVAPQRRHQRVQQLIGLIDPAGQRGAVQLNAAAGVDAALAVQGQVVAILGDQHMGQQAGAGHTTRNRAARCAGLEDRLAAHANQLGPHMPDHLEVCRHVLQLLGDVLPDLAQPGTAGRAAAGLARTVVMAVAELGQVFLDVARQMRRQTAVDLRVIGGGRHRDTLGTHAQCGLVAIDQRYLCRPLFTGGAELGAHATQQLQLELVDHQLEQCHLAIARLDDAQQFFVARR